ncbi:protein STRICTOSIDINE SYNTHASE-LIKE 2 isoform X2 [Populus alba]|uniref:Strictosidine synthase 3-like n=2 Tax=Populus TaxID=3689 RepID=A0A4U5PNA7_POPAL|nr:protein STRICTOSIDINE SYNTHASE-LIKE 2-like isoform X2 [Populus alba]KAJ6967924.1 STRICTOSIDINE SYNTHASE-LIKE 2-like isoform X2 [Populus alba x Populus x berolinensis]TKR97856.1 strictosidine synthase 3-like [Populus alba]
MAAKLFLTATTAVLISALIAINHEFVYQPSVIEKGHGQLWEWETLSLDGATGPESFALDPLRQGPYAGISDGRIIKWEEHERRWINFAITSQKRDGCGGPHDHHQMEHVCGRPLGSCFDETHGDLYIADAYMGLLRVGPEGGLATTIATHAQGIPFRFTNSLDIDQSSGAIYFTDSSTQYHRRDYLSVVLSGDKSGRLMKYDTASKQVTVLLENLTFPNGVALSEDGSFVLLAETTSCRILRYWIKTSKAGALEVFAQLQGFPDNIKRSPRGGYWVGINSKREKLSELLFSYPWIGKVLLKLPLDMTKVQAALAKYRGGGLAVRLSENGDIVEVLEDRDGNRLRSVSEVMEKDGKLWIGSIDLPFAGRFKI